MVQAKTKKVFKVNENNTKILISLPTNVRGMIVRGVAYRILNSGHDLMHRDIPSIGGLINEMIAVKLKLNIELPPISNSFKTVLMVHLRARLHSKLAEEAKKTGSSNTKLVEDLIQKTDLSSLILKRDENIQERERMVPTTFVVSSVLRRKIYHEIAIRILNSQKTNGRGEFSSIGEIINELLAHNFDLSLPIKLAQLEKTGDSVKTTILIGKQRHEALQKHCKENGSTVNKFIIKLIEEIACYEMW